MKSEKPTWRGSLSSSYSAAFQIFSSYWKDYGGIRALATSPYFHAALVFTAVATPFWLEGNWWDVSLDFLPSALGFSLAAFAMILAFGNETFISVMATKAKGRDKAAFQRVSNAFFHFLVVQFFAFLSAFLCKAYFRTPSEWLVNLLNKFHINIDVFVTFTHVFWGVSFLLTSYSIMCGLTASVRVYRLANSFVKVMNSPRIATSKSGTTAKAEQIEPTAENSPKKDQVSKD